MRNISRVFIDLDGTLAGYNEWRGFFWNTFQLFKTGLLMDIPQYSWNILTSRPRVDRIFINKLCKKHKIKPEKIITVDSWRYPFKNDEDVINWKSSILYKSLNNFMVDCVVYVDNDLKLLSQILPHKNLILCSSASLKNVIEELNTDKENIYDTM